MVKKIKQNYNPVQKNETHYPLSWEYPIQKWQRFETIQRTEAGYGVTTDYLSCCYGWHVGHCSV